MKKDLFFLMALCLVAGLIVGVNIGESVERNTQIPIIEKERSYYEQLLVKSKKKQDSLIKKIDSLSQVGTVIVENIKHIPVYIKVPYDTLGSVKLQELMIKEYIKQNERN